MPSLLRNSTADGRALFGLLLLSVIVVFAWFGWGDDSPDRVQAEQFLAWGFRNNSSGVEGLDEAGQATRLKPAMVTGIDDVECHRFQRERSWFSSTRRLNAPPRHDCIYRLKGAAGRTYWTVVATTYDRRDPYKMTHVGPYILSFRAADPDQRAILAEHGVKLPAS